MALSRTLKVTDVEPEFFQGEQRHIRITTDPAEGPVPLRWVLTLSMLLRVFDGAAEDAGAARRVEVRVLMQAGTPVAGQGVHPASVLIGSSPLPFANAAEAIAWRDKIPLAQAALLVAEGTSP